MINHVNGMPLPVSFMMRQYHGYITPYCFSSPYPYRQYLVSPSAEPIGIPGVPQTQGFPVPVPAPYPTTPGFETQYPVMPAPAPLQHPMAPYPQSTPFVSQESIQESINEIICKQCAHDCFTKAVPCDPGKWEWVGPEEMAVRSVKASDGKEWRKFRRKQRICVVEKCEPGWGLFKVYCCEYTKWKEEYREYWKVKYPGGTEYYIPPKSSHCECGSLVELLDIIMLAPFDKKETAFEKYKGQYCAYYTKYANLKEIAESCGMTDLWEKATSPNSYDFYLLFYNILRAFRRP